MRREKREFHGMRGEFHPHKTHLARLPSFFVFGNRAMKLALRLPLHPVEGSTQNEIGLLLSVKCMVDETMRDWGDHPICTGDSRENVLAFLLNIMRPRAK